MLAEFLCFLTAFIVLLFGYVNWRPKNYPKGPFSVPILGHLHLLALKTKNGNIHAVFSHYAQKYGPAVAIDLAAFPTVVLHNHELIKEAWNNPLLCGRPKLHGTMERTGGISRGMMFQDGEEWSEQRRFTLKNLRDLGFGKKSMENLVTDEIRELIEELRDTKGGPISTQNRFNIAVVNALWSIIAGERFNYSDPKLKEIIAAITRNISTGTASAVFFMPWLTKMAPKLSGWEKFKADLPYTYNFLHKYAKSRIESYEGDNPQHFTDKYIDEIRRTTNQNSSFYGLRGELTMTAILQDLFLAGAETTSTTLTWLCLYMAVFPEEQAKLHGEIDRVLGSKFPSLDDRTNMPQTEAIILETLRFSSMVPLGLFHRAMEDVQLGPYFIPKNTILTANLHAVHHDPRVWGDPENFRPHRFLSKDNRSVIKHEALIPFSYGKRICPGEGSANLELFLFTTGIFQQFKVTWDPNEPKPGVDQTGSAIACPMSHKLIFKERGG